MLASEIISNYQLQTDDQTQLSDAEALALLNRVLRKIYNTRPWGFLMKSYTGSVSNKSMDLPTDYQYLIPTYDANGETLNIYSLNDVVRVIPWDEVRNYTQGVTEPNVPYAYVDLRTDTIKLLTTRYNGKDMSMDYIYSPSSILTTGSPAIPSRFQDILPYLMTVESNTIDQGEKGMSYTPENNSAAYAILEDMIYWDNQHKTYGTRV
jgi:hypothetical protein